MRGKRKRGAGEPNLPRPKAHVKEIAMLEVVNAWLIGASLQIAGFLIVATVVVGVPIIIFNAIRANFGD